MFLGEVIPCGCAEPSQREAGPARLDPVQHQDWERIQATVRGQLNDEEFAAAWAEGQAMSLEDAIKLALL